MRKTLTICGELFAISQNLAKRSGSSLNRAISVLALRGSREFDNPDVDDGIPCFQVAPDSRTVSNEDVREALSDGP